MKIAKLTAEKKRYEPQTPITPHQARLNRFGELLQAVRDKCKTLPDLFAAEKDAMKVIDDFPIDETQKQRYRDFLTNDFDSIRRSLDIPDVLV